MKKLVLSLTLLVTLFYAKAQVEEILIEGKVSDSRSGKGIQADIRYSSIPTGSIKGNFKDSTFAFSIFGTAKYQVTAMAKGYNTRTIIINPKEMEAGNRISRNIALVPKGETIILNHLIFAQGKSTIDPSSFPELDEVVQMMKENSKIVIQLEGHTDNVGNPKANMKLSEDRVEAVKKYIASKDIAKDRIKTKAFGGSQPLRNEMTPEARALNRRVEMRILKD